MESMDEDEHFVLWQDLISSPSSTSTSGNFGSVSVKASGPGTRRLKHGKDWYGMCTKILRAMHDTIYRLYADACPSLDEHNPYENDVGSLELQEIREKDVFRRYSLLSDRLENLTKLLGHYLSEPFVAPKPVPMKSILNIICKMIIINPVDLVKNKGQENTYIANLLPSIHCSALHLLQNLLQCVGSNLLVDAVRIEQLTLQEFKWTTRNAQEYWKVRVALYKFLGKWVDVSGGFVTVDKVMTSWVDQMQSDIQIEKRVVEINLQSPKLSKSKGKKGQVGRLNVTSAIAGSSVQVLGESTIIKKSSDLCTSALEFLRGLIPTLDKDSHRIAYELTAKTIMEFPQSPVIPSPYDNQNSRICLFRCVRSLAMNPHPRSPVSLGILINLIRQNLSDPSPGVVKTCQIVLSFLERIVHPIAPSFNFPSVFSNPELSEPTTAGMEVDSEEEESLQVQTVESSCQTEDEDGGLHPRLNVWENFKNNDTCPALNNNFVGEKKKYQENNTHPVVKDYATKSEKNGLFPVPNNFVGKDEDDDIKIIKDLDPDEDELIYPEDDDEYESVTPQENGDYPNDLLPMLNDFVDKSPEHQSMIVDEV